MSLLKDKLSESREKKREQAASGWSRLLYMVLLLFFIGFLLFKTNNSKFDVFWNVFQGDVTKVEEIQENR